MLLMRYEEKSQTQRIKQEDLEMTFNEKLMRREDTSVEVLLEVEVADSGEALVAHHVPARAVGCFSIKRLR